MPSELRSRPQWVGWRVEQRDGKPTKVPTAPHGDRMARVNDPTTWGLLSEVDLDRCDGIGFVFTAGDPYCGIDLDGCRDRRTGTLSVWAKRILEELDSYAEISPSQSGVHIFVRGTLPEEGRRWGSIELYDQGRYFTVTGWRVPDAAAEIRQRESRLRELLPALRLLGQALGRLPRDVRWHDLAAGLWENHDYPSQSEADLAWCSRLFQFAPLDNRGRDLVDQVFRWTGLYRPDKWERRDYREATLDRAASRQAPQAAGEKGAPSLEMAVALERNRRAARRQVDAEEAGSDFRMPESVASVAEWMLADIPDPSWRVEGLLVEGQNALLAAQFKAGKTTLLMNLLHSLCDGVPFLGHFARRSVPTDEEGERRVGYWNLELPALQCRRWLREIGIRELDRLALVNLRGHNMNLVSPAYRKWAVDWLIENRVGTWLIDPLGALYRGEENSNSEVREFLMLLDEIRESAGVSEVVMAHHFGRQKEGSNGEHGRGATRLDDWADARWMLALDVDTGVRYFSAHGRDVDVEEHPLAYDHFSRELVFRAQEEARASRSRSSREDPEVAAERLQAALLEYVRGHPGVSRNELVKGTTVKGRTASKNAALQMLEQERKIRKNRDGTLVRLYADGQRGSIA